ncbi:hypothetical protein ACFU8I_18045 [Streptomyces sp. NPDC057540]|uniref:hypothetical protein n=1 Tax=Streptomyces sp. NPDC057540 TaxID=3346160 RepID=UPI0036D1EAE9
MVVGVAGPDAVVRGVEVLTIEDVEGLLGWLFSRLDPKASGALATAQFAEERVREQLARRDAETVPGWSVLSRLAQDWQFLRQVARGIAGVELPDDRTVIWKGTFDYIPRDPGVGATAASESMLWGWGSSRPGPPSAVPELRGADDVQD